FMNSSVKQAQKDGASIENISAGLSISVIKNALYKVIRPSSREELGQHIVVQGGTFHNDAVLRAFEQELGLEVVRPDIAGLMGAYGAAHYAMQRKAQDPAPSTTLSAQQLAAFTHEVSTAHCGACQNNCLLTVNRFEGGRRLISGNRCERPVTQTDPDERLNLYLFKREKLKAYLKPPSGRPVIGLPMGLNFYELLPFWSTVFDRLGYDVVVSPTSDHDLYLLGQGTIPSDTACYPAKLMHGHIQALIDRGVTTVFYPCMSYSIDEQRADNCFNCPVVAYYPEVIRNNMPDVRSICFIGGYVGLHRPRELPDKLHALLSPHLPGLTTLALRWALDAGYAAHAAHLAEIRARGRQIIAQARAEQKPILVLAGRPYHIDPEINHGIDKLITTLGAAVVSEDAVCDLPREHAPLEVLNQWTYHSRLYDAAMFTAGQPDMHFVQLVSFGCGCDAITSDECRRLLERKGHIYTQIKIDEIDNLGAARIRLRSLFAAIEMTKTADMTRVVNV
ncbi:MAG: 2-hydroxyglutaryl-CoA dehydratase, partial [Clostridiales bacterium]|nr:2-hydroxyglutaryl-CoA dehydratase [Clostridiales bacterium]